MQKFYILRRIFQVFRFATMQQFYFLKIISKFTILQQCNNATILHLRDNSKFTVLQQCNNATMQQCNNATMQQFYFLEMILSFPFCNNFTSYK